MSEEVKKEEVKEEVKSEVKPNGAKPTDFKILEVWYREGRLMIDAGEDFWKDKLRAIGMFEMCKDIVKSAELPKPKIIHPGRGGIMNFVRSHLGRR